jgi:hypothetical protein
MKTKNIFIMLLFSSLFSCCSKDEYKFTGEEKDIFLCLKLGDIFTMKDDNSTPFSFNVTNSNSRLVESETFNLGTNNFYESSTLEFQSNNKNCGGIYCYVMSSKQTSFILNFTAFNPIIEFEIGKIINDRSLNQFKIWNYTIDGITYENVYLFADTLYKYDSLNDTTLSNIQRIYLNAENGILKLEDEASKRVFTIDEN